MSLDTWADVSTSSFIKTEDVAEQPMTLTIKSIGKEDVSFQGGESERVTLVRFEETEKAVIAKTAILSWLKESHPTPAACIGAKVELYKDPSVVFGGKKVGGLRFRAPSGSASPF